MSTIIATVTDAYGGFGGIAQYNRDFYDVVADSPGVERVIVLPRIVAAPPEALPPRIDHRTDGLGGIRAYAAASAKLLNGEHPQAVICGHVNLLPFAAPIAVRYRVPLVLMVYGIEVWKPPRLASRALLGLVDHIVSISQLTVDKMLEWSTAPTRCCVSILPNAVDLTRFRPTAMRPEGLVRRYRLHERRVIMTLARLVARERYKGVREVIELMPELLASHPDLVYLVVGNGDDLESIRSFAASQGINDRLIFAGRIPEDEKVAHYQLADAYVMPGRGEGFGFVFLEAMACGIPVVASVLDGSREAVRFGALGELSDPRDRNSILVAIRRALGKQRGQVPEGLEYFDVPHFRQRVRSLVSTILAGQ